MTDANEEKKKRKAKKGPQTAEERKEALNRKIKTVYTKKNYIDATAALMYSLGCSLVHLSLLFTIFFVKRSDL